jgi:hypothetical protein
MNALLALSLHQWSDVAQLSIAVTAMFALAGAAAQLWYSRVSARRQRAYDYADCINTREMLRATAEYGIYWKKHTFAEFLKEDPVRRIELNMLPNLMEEVASLYNRKLVDRTIVAQLLGTYAIKLWEVSGPSIADRRAYNDDLHLYAEWEEMQKDAPTRQAKADRRADRRRARKRLLLNGP